MVQAPEEEVNMCALMHPQAKEEAGIKQSSVDAPQLCESQLMPCPIQRCYGLEFTGALVMAPVWYISPDPKHNTVHRIPSFMGCRWAHCRITALSMSLASRQGGRHKRTLEMQAVIQGAQ